MTALFAQVAANNTNELVGGGVSTPSSEMDNLDAGGVSGFGDQSMFLEPGPPITLTNLLPVLLRRFPVTGQHAALLTQFCQALLQLVAAQEAHTTQNAVAYNIPTAIKNIVKLYVIAFIMSSQTSACRGLDAAAHIMNAIRESFPNAGIPDAGDAVRIPVLSGYIQKKLTGFRNQVKQKLEASCQRKDDVATLANALVGSNTSRPPPTLQIYYRAAVFRYLYEVYGNEEESSFWGKVDAALAAIRAKGATEALATITHLYNLDRAKYGDPAMSGLAVAEPATVPAWQVTLGRHAALVTPRPQSESRKRARRDGNENNEEQEDSMDS
ncbi:hypothetical protein MKEN_01034400 [Mycena kentingensis (nom. inval.)]|nr:hypothetical protein MKEN_01034400 [Mycena kentingensis (nom. inval.)]